MLKNYLFNIIPGLDVTPKEADCLLGLGEALDLVSHNTRNLRDAIDAVTWWKVEAHFNKKRLDLLGAKN